MFCQVADALTVTTTDTVVDTDGTCDHCEQDEKFHFNVSMWRFSRLNDLTVEKRAPFISLFAPRTL